MNWLRKLPGYQRSPPGMEWVLWRWLPKVLAIGTMVPAVLALVARVCITQGTAAAVDRHVQLFDYVMVGLVIFIWTAVLTVGIGCVIVWLMKGPAYVADGFEVSHSEQPRR